MEKQNYTHVQVLLPEIKAMLAEGGTQRKVAEYSNLLSEIRRRRKWQQMVQQIHKCWRSAEITISGCGQNLGPQEGLHIHVSFIQTEEATTAGQRLDSTNEHSWFDTLYVKKRLFAG